MKAYNHLFLVAASCLALAVLLPALTSCSCDKPEVVVSDLIMNDDFEVLLYEDGSFSGRNKQSGEITIRKIHPDWTQDSANDSLSVFCSEGKRGYYNSYTGVIAVPAQYRRAWVFSEGLAAVQQNGNIGFIDHQGNVVIDFLFPFYGNPISDFVFHNGVCVVANKDGKCGVIDKTGAWLIEPEWDYVSAFKEYAVVTSDGVRKQVTYDGVVLNSFVLDDIEELTFCRNEYNQYVVGHMEELNVTHYTGLFAYRVGGRWGLMDAKCNRLTEPLYAGITAVDSNIFRAELLDGYSEVILNAKGEIMK
ncbi:MAG: WG repeat-containing protein [Bacteroidales bacterium]|nr:WG repeat-containing protein [Bacteroidales bacterium]